MRSLPQARAPSGLADLFPGFGMPEVPADAARELACGAVDVALTRPSGGPVRLPHLAWCGAAC